MKNLQNSFAAVLILSLLAGICWANDEPNKPQPDPEKARLKIEGDFILSLVLEKEQGQPVAIVSSMSDYEITFSRPNRAEPQNITDFVTLSPEDRTALLAPGRYRWNSVIVRDQSKNLKFSAYNFNNDWFVMTRGVTKTLKIGAPLKQALKVSRSGALLNFDYKLLGAAGESYTPYQPELKPPERPKYPGLSIHKAGEEIHSGSFRYG
jgi:hypothetical protein